MDTRKLINETRKALNESGGSRDYVRARQSLSATMPRAANSLGITLNEAYDDLGLVLKGKTPTHDLINETATNLTEKYGERTATAVITELVNAPE